LSHRCTQGGRGGTSCTPYKDFEKLPHKNAIKMTPPNDFLTTPSYPLKRICQKPDGPPPPPGFPTTVHLCSGLTIKPTFEGKIGLEKFRNIAFLYIDLESLGLTKITKLDTTLDYYADFTDYN
jgi:hypothetical protein